MGGIFAALLAAYFLSKQAGTTTERRVSLVKMDSAQDARPQNGLMWNQRDSPGNSVQGQLANPFSKKELAYTAAV